MGSIDIKVAYYCVPIREENKKYLKSVSDGQLFQFTCLLNGHVISAYIDDMFNLGMTYQECQ